jgi:hypothetical protein
MKRVGSVGMLADSGGSPFELLGRFLAKTVALGVTVVLITNGPWPRLVQEVLYGMSLWFRV